MLLEVLDMALKKIKIGSLITECNEKNSDDIDYPFFGINIDKEFMPSVAATDSVDRSKYKIVKKGTFVFSGMQTGRDCCIRIGMYEKDDIVLVSPAYTTFIVSSPLIIPEYLFMYFRSSEKDRYGAFLSDGSIRSNLDWNVFCDIELELPSIEIQCKYVEIYKGMVDNQAAYETGLEDLKLVCDSFIEDLRRKMSCKEIGPYIKKEDKNTDGKIIRVLGIGQNGFINPQKTPNESLKNYKILRSGDIGYAPPLYNVLTGALHCYREDKMAVCSPIYEVFRCDECYLLPEYLTMWLKREEFKRYAAFYALGVRQTFDYQLMEEVKIPIPPIDVQKAIVDIYRSYNMRKEVNEQLKQQIKNICPILIKGAVEEELKHVKE